ncbi:MAG: UvrD-helicase domain-containing protein [Colwellia polaris]|jgi:DNA helicase-2/ATP-dependent DNA helicase PcrA|uniref:UvrD-helicase domain-containing protein n=1 Tax=Colwellia polaris TaxID=326537 RepID=UPI000A1782BB|nr:UvrD-helicase domain-containing protein [Colwellia polaris]|tara:strand:+ start:37601 stop:39358 length:1758 start_codon:yes stop_codon:yes gene_type:complete
MTVEFTQEQLHYVNSSIAVHTFLEACPGSGKTEVVAAKVSKEISNWKGSPGGLVTLSFANSATDELKIRISKYLPHGRSMFPHFLGTFDSFIYKNIVSPISIELTGYIGEDGDSSIRIIEPSSHIGYRTKYNYAKRGQVSAHHYSFDLINDSVIFEIGDPALNRTLNSIALEDWGVNDFIDTKKRMLKGGFATYRDIECLALEALTDAKYDHFVKLLVKRYPLFIIDECQDLSVEQLTILKALADKGVKLHFVGDLHQAIYSFRDVDPAKVKQFVVDNNFTSLQLTRNFRSCQNIVDLCAKLTGRGNIIGNVSWLESRCLVLQYTSCPTELISTFEEKCNGFGNNVVLSRGHSILRKFQTSLAELNNIQKLALAVKSYNPDDMEGLSHSLQYFSEFIRHHLKESFKPNSFNCPQSIDSNLTWRKFLCESLKYLHNKELHNIGVTWSTWTKSAKTLIRDLPNQRFCSDAVANILAPLNEVNLTSPSGLAKQEVASSLGAVTKSTLSFKKSTIHGAKGETHDVTILISSARAGNDSHWSNWIKNPNSEDARFAYVASSRPKEYLIWAVKKLKPIDKIQLEGIGFSII